MRIVFRVDSGLIIGTGHLMRCLNLANYFKKYDHEIIFICKNHRNNLIDLLAQYKVYVLETKCKVDKNTNTWLGDIWENDIKEVINIIKSLEIDLLIIDHYAIDIKWENKVRNYVEKIFVIDDLADRKHNCDILLDQNINDNNYQGLVPKECKILQGPSYVILSEEFLKYQPTIKKEVKRINVCFGGFDNYGITEKITKELAKVFENSDIIFDIIIGSEASYQRLKKDILNGNFNIYFRLEHKKLIELFSKTDLCIGSTGTSIYERCYFGIPTIVITIADNQVDIAKKMDRMNLIKYIGDYNNINLINIINLLNHYINSMNYLEKQSENCYRIIDGYGYKRIYNNINKILSII